METFDIRKKLLAISKASKSGSNNAPVRKFIGHIDILDGNVLKGWAIDSDSNGATVEIEVCLNGEIIGTGRADLYRQDLKNLNYGNGCHGFHIKLDTKIFSGNNKNLTINESGTGQAIRSNKFSLTPPTVKGVRLLSASPHSITGTLDTLDNPTVPVLVTLTAPNGQQITDEQDCSWSMGSQGYTFSISTESLQDGDLHQFQISTHGDATGYKSEIYHYSSQVHKHAELLSDMFFAPYYIRTNNLQELSVADAFKHYLAVGIYRNFNPNPWIDSNFIRRKMAISGNDIPVLAYIHREKEPGICASELFSPALYREANPDIGDVISPLHHLCKYGINQNRPIKPLVYNDKVLTEIANVSAYEPDINFHTDVMLHKLPNVHRGTYVTEILADRIGHEVEVLICVPFVSIGGADYIATRIASVISDGVGADKIVLLVTDTNNMAGSHWLSKGIKTVLLEDVLPEVPVETKSAILHKAVATVCPSKIINVNSHVCWQMYDDYGRFLSQVVELYSYIFCFDYDHNSKPVGYVPDYLDSTIDYLNAIISDNQAFIDEIFDIYGFTEKYRSKFHCAYTPYENKLPEWKGSDRVGSILWCGRLCEQKNIDLLVEIAETISGITIDVYGPAGESPLSSVIVNGGVSNIVYRGVYSDISEVELSQYNALLYTSNWDGLPVVLINMMAAGIPIISSNVGGINELLNSNNSFLVSEDAAVDEYVQALVTLCYSDYDASALSRSGIEEVTSMNSMEQYTKKISEVVLGEKAIGFQDINNVSEAA